MDQHVLRAPAARRAGSRQRAPTAAPGTRDLRGQARAGAAQISLPGPDGQRPGGERGLPGVRGVLGRAGGAGSRRGRGDRVGELGSVLRRGPRRAAIGVAVVRHADPGARGAGATAADLGGSRRCGPASCRRHGRVIHRAGPAVSTGVLSLFPTMSTGLSTSAGLSSHAPAGGGPWVSVSSWVFGASPRASSSSTSPRTSSGTWPPAVHSAQRIPTKLPMPV